MIRLWFLIVLFCHLNKISHGNSIAPTHENVQPQDEWESTYGKILFSAVVFRHGEHYPFSDPPPRSDAIFRHRDRYSPRDPAASAKWGEEWTRAENGQLTKKGKNRAYQLGRWLRERYSHLINDQPYNPWVLNMLSSHTDRTIMSAQLLLAGLYPPDHENEMWNKDILWQPIPVYALPDRHRLISARESCPRFDVEMEDVMNSPEILSFYASHRKIMDDIQENTVQTLPYKGIDPRIESILIAAQEYHYWETAVELGWKRPEWFETNYNQSVRNAIGWTSLKLRCSNHQQKRIKGGPLLGHIVYEMKRKRDNARSPKVFQLYSGHDRTIVTLLSMLGVYDGRLPGYCSALLFELRKLEEDYIVTVAYMNEGDESLILENMDNIPKAPKLCTLDDFIKATKDLIPVNWDAECKVPSSGPDYFFV